MSPVSPALAERFFTWEAQHPSIIRKTIDYSSTLLSISSMTPANPTAQGEAT